MGSPRYIKKQAAAGPRGSRTCVCANTFVHGVAHAGEGKGRINVVLWYRPVGVESTTSQTHEGKIGLPARVSGHHVVQGRQSSPTLPNSQP